ncbi:hypothetical protein OB955_11125 [Halobacteria archaeon AArc-m2/3/4]|uniref:Uncharacterized protein n=1 Tax=Natronoglomus mannanivorans TaxID=2979990 RepID=A0AAP2YZ63_9EURY|nr:hypothetical protein [Halobacteria archaeon AArc-xg1-1]MCU4973294.1 hypothetical protein [Halobacteria archaeon AArc-m2/3/4]
MGRSEPRWATATRGIAVLATAYVTVGLLWTLSEPGYSRTRAAFFALLAVLALVGGVGAVLDDSRLLVGGGAGLFLLGFWQAALWIFLLPAAFVLLFAGMLTWEFPESERTAA